MLELSLTGISVAIETAIGELVTRGINSKPFLPTQAESLGTKEVLADRASGFNFWKTVCWPDDIILLLILFKSCIWSIHFPVILAMNIVIPMQFNIIITGLSVIVTIIANFLNSAIDTLVRMFRKYPLYYAVDAETDPIDHTENDSVSSQSPRGLNSKSEDALEGLINPDTISGLDQRTAAEQKRGICCQITLAIILRAFCLRVSICTVHYREIWATGFDRILEWNKSLVCLSFLPTWGLSIVALAFIPREINQVQQISFFIAALYVSLIHYLGMWAATFHTSVALSYDRSMVMRSSGITFTVALIAIGSCFLSYILLAHFVVTSRKSLADKVATKQNFWKVITQKQAAERANSIKTEFISIASHEIRTPLHAISGYADLLEASHLSVEQATYVQNIVNGCRLIQLITNNVLDFAKLERGNKETEANPAKTEIRKLIQSVVNAAGEKKGVEIIASVKPSVAGDFLVDEVYLTRVLMNLLSNSLKFTESGSVVVEVYFCCSEGKSNLVIKVRDTGIGIPKEFCSTIFEPFRQADTNLTRKHTGTGLGLAITKQLVNLMFGTIVVNSTIEQGTEFTVTIPSELGFPADDTTTSFMINLIWSDELIGETIRIFLESCSAGCTRIEPSLFQAFDDSVIVSNVLIDEMLRVKRRIFLYLDTDTKCLPSNIIVLRRPIIIHSLIGLINASSEIITPTSFDTLNPVQGVRMSSYGGKSVHFQASVKVLLVEDNTINQQLGIRLLEQLGYEVGVAENGRIALDRLSSEKFDLILMDSQMPVMNGFECMRAIRNSERISGRHIPIISLTANVSSQSRQECLEAGADMFLPKPLRLHELKEACIAFTKA
ncbi:Hybrid signal transduction histidine kinase J [Neolecta irregularis DAH-3]|uniref:Hybrid signal transduction histidine kinase J n=1 Tax=Neolecta irregularis (strain DAH-3) TaxID=1198029 RepID=A0A1U7LP44_NEOID|nr:Hybrid signal transduction histidine kinase J [Neolecta irregularis DAH-3]|eukprot:OLL24398.1 Hybrid signal transduction histidine kinase J [Neolecta irregularis DAH-3]